MGGVSDNVRHRVYLKVEIDDDLGGGLNLGLEVVPALTVTHDISGRRIDLTGEPSDLNHCFELWFTRKFRSPKYRKLEVPLAQI